MKSIILVLVGLLLPASAWGDDRPSFKLLAIVRSSSTIYPGTMATQLYEDTWYVLKGSNTLTLSEFVQSGKFCEWRGKHEWDFNTKLNHDTWQWEDGYKCIFCKKIRQKTKTKVTHEEDRWEP